MLHAVFIYVRHIVLLPDEGLVFSSKQVKETMTGYFKVITSFLPLWDKTLGVMWHLHRGSVCLLSVCSEWRLPLFTLSRCRRELTTKRIRCIRLTSCPVGPKVSGKKKRPCYSLAWWRHYGHSANASQKGRGSHQLNEVAGSLLSRMFYN